MIGLTENDNMYSEDSRGVALTVLRNYGLRAVCNDASTVCETTHNVDLFTASIIVRYSLDIKSHDNFFVIIFATNLCIGTSIKPEMDTAVHLVQ